jgi:hypothetical protein
MGAVLSIRGYSFGAYHSSSRSANPRPPEPILRVSCRLVSVSAPARATNDKRKTATGSNQKKMKKICNKVNHPCYLLSAIDSSS